MAVKHDFYQNHTAWYAEGMEASHCEISPAKCPYKDGSSAQLNWLRGFADAEDDRRKEPMTAQPAIIKLRPEVSDALDLWNQQRTGRGCDRRGVVTDPQVIARIVSVALPQEDLNDTILRVLRGSASTASH